MRSLAAVIALMAATTTANAQPIAVPQPPPGFTVTLPAGWTHQVLPTSPVYLAAYPPSGGCRCVVSAAANGLQGSQATINQRPMTPLDKPDWALIFPFYVNYKPIVSDFGLHASGIMAYRGHMRFISYATNQRQQVLAYVLATAGTTYAVACASLETSWPQHEVDIGIFANSFHVNGITLAKPEANPKPAPDGNKQELETFGKEVGPLLEKFLTFRDLSKN